MSGDDCLKPMLSYSLVVDEEVTWPETLHINHTCVQIDTQSYIQTDEQSNL